MEIINEIIKLEGGYINDPSDSGGETNFGITKSTARVFGFTGPMQDLTREMAFDIYVAKYWDAVRADDLLKLSEGITSEVVDTSVNMGPSRAGKFLQRALNTLNDRGNLYPDLVVDGAIGPMSVKMLDKYLQRRDEKVLIKMLNCLQGAFYVRLAERREKDERFIYGWFKNRINL